MAVFFNKEMKGHEQVVFCQDPSSGLKAIIAIHDTTLGPSLGGCRLWNYANEEEALTDVLRLSRGMTYKAAVSGLNLGGGKAVIIGDPQKIKSEALFRSFGKFVDSLGGRYITAEDVNIRVSDMEIITKETKYCSGVSDGGGDPSPVTAYGVYWGIKASAKKMLGTDRLEGVRIAVQGCGAVGTYLCQHLASEGAKLFIADINKNKVDSLTESLGATPVDLKNIHSQNVDIFAPCALGGILNNETIPQINAKVIAGGANNQLLNEPVHAKMLQERGILYAPDYVINAGGVMNCYQELIGYDADAAKEKAKGIYETLLSIYDQSARDGITPGDASNLLAEQRIKNAKQEGKLRNSMRDQPWFKA